MEQVILTVTGMHCNSCGMLIDDALEELPGVKQSRTSVRKGKTVVDHDGKVSASKILKTVSSLGYKARVSP